MPSAFRSLAVFAFVSAVVVVSVPGCSQQGQGERCDQAKTGNADCEDGLTCVPHGQLLENITDRCCPAANTESDARCTRKGQGSNSGGSGGSSGSSTAGSATGGANGGAADVPTGGTSAGAVSNAGGMSVGGMPVTSTDGGASGAPVDAAAGTGGAG